MMNLKNNMSEIFVAQTDSQIRACFPVVVQLRPSYSEDSFLVQVKNQLAMNYHLVYMQYDETVCAVAGYRYLENLAWGKFMYVDDLITDYQQRSKGYGKILLDWLIEEAKKDQCQQLHLDSGVQRTDAHRFYKREGLNYTSQHYALDLI